MPTRRDFLEGSVIAGGLAFAASSPARAEGRARFQDKLTDDAGKYAVAPLPYGYVRSSLPSTRGRSSCITTITTSPPLRRRIGRRKSWPRRAKAGSSRW